MAVTLFTDETTNTESTVGKTFNSQHTIFIFADPDGGATVKLLLSPNGTNWAERTDLTFDMSTAGDVSENVYLGEDVLFKAEISGGTGHSISMWVA